MLHFTGKMPQQAWLHFARNYEVPTEKKCFKEKTQELNKKKKNPNQPTKPKPQTNKPHQTNKNSTKLIRKEHAI